MTEAASSGPAGTLYALVPAKRFVSAKSRLAEALSPAERQALAQTLLARALESCLGCAAFDRVYLLTSDSSGPEWAARYGVRWLPDGAATSFDAVVTAALDTLTADGAASVCYVASDLPQVDAESLSELVAGPAEASAFAPARRDGGTNAFYMPLPRRIEIAFGPGSAAAHVARMLATGLPARIAPIAALALDVDVPQDLEGLPTRAALGTLAS
ncbi:MAG TPA: 2-phospho-L-lactate guanylyltransferase [Steroidobacteraceae bacterium]|nr:2-phospho-L-lactate guanylyltransferase [Steroidobacteraceae bacterium]